MRLFYSFVLSFFFLFISEGVGWAQDMNSISSAKLDVGMKLALRQSGFHNPDGIVKSNKHSIPADTLLPAILRCADSQVVVSTLQEWGIEACVILPSVATARIPAASVAEVAMLPGVIQIAASRKAYPVMAKSRVMTGMDKVHSGEGLESPYTGKGVVLGVIDQGFEYTHPAFSTPDGQLRIKRVWNRYKDQDSLLTVQDILAEENDGYDGMHATHVTGIAAGSKIEGNDFYGNAPDAELVMVPSNFEGQEVLEDVKFIHDYAAAQGKPCVINMSFGGQIGPHDGTTDFDRTMDQLVGKGKIVVGAVGNDADIPVHLEKIFRTERDTLRFLLSPRSDVFFLYMLGGNEQSFNGTLFLYDPVRQSRIFLDNRILWNYVSMESAVNEDNGKMTAIFAIRYEALKKYLGFLDDFLVGMEVFDAPANYVFHAWVNYFHAAFSDGGRTDGYFTPGDAQYTIGELGASPSRTLAVGAYASCTEWTALNGETVRNMGFGQVGDVANFSNYGPQLDNDLPKPLICAPGLFVTSAYSKQEASFNPETNMVTARISKDGEDFYYGVEAGTSMSSPQVAGIIACWMQAYPQLTPEQAMEIIQKTAINDEYTGNIRETWHNQWGYGKINAYEGLKECIKLAAETGMNETLNSETPVTIYKSRDSWKIFFNNDETDVSLTLYSLNSVPVMQRELSNVSCGHEELISLSEYVPGWYLLRIRTAKAFYSRKILIE